MADVDVAKSSVAFGIEGAKKSTDNGASVLAMANTINSGIPLVRELASVFIY